MVKTCETIILTALALLALAGCKKADGDLNGCECDRNLDCLSGYCYLGVCMQVTPSQTLARFQCSTHSDCGCGGFCISFAYNYNALRYVDGCLAPNQQVRHGYLCVVPCTTYKNCPQGMNCTSAVATPKTGSKGQPCSQTGITHDYGGLSKAEHEALWAEVKVPGYCVW